MPAARDLVKALSGLGAGNSARAHVNAITLTPAAIYGGIAIANIQESINAEILDETMVANLKSDTIVINQATQLTADLQDDLEAKIL